MKHVRRVQNTTISANRAWPRLSIVLLGVMLVATACGSSGSTASSDSKPMTPVFEGTLTVAAAASLTGVFTGLGKQFQDKYPDTKVEFNFGSSGVLMTQITNGAPADVFASADSAVMGQAQKVGVLAGTPQTFARNTLEMVVRPGNPLGIKTLADLERANVVALCATNAPCGASAAKVLARAGVELKTSQVTRGQDVKATLRQVTVGDADAAIVYVTDARTIGSMGQAVPIPAAQNLITDYPIAMVKGVRNPALAVAWIPFVLGPNGQAALRAAGFKVPS